MGRRLLGLSLFACVVTPAVAQNANLCDVPGEAPDVVVAAIDQAARVGGQNGVSAYTLGNTHCNLGTCQADWFHSSNRHPVLAQNAYRFDGRSFEQIGQSWVTHAYFALSSSYCSSECVATNGTTLGVNCSDVNAAVTQAQQANMGPRSEVNAATGEFVMPFGTQGQTGNVLNKRLQVRDSDLDPALHPGATYFTEVQFVTADDAAAGNNYNNASWRQVLVVPGPNGTFVWQVTGATERGKPAIRAWAAADPGVLLTEIKVPDDGVLTLGARVTGLGGGLWHYEYALQNSTSHRAAGSFRVPLPQGAPVADVGFHDVDSHSGEPYDVTDWPWRIEGAKLVWDTVPFEQSANANALRWGTLYNFRFVSSIPPALGPVTVGLFRPGIPATMTVATLAPAPCDGDGACEPGELPCACFSDCGAPDPLESACADGDDGDCDGRTDCEDGDCCAAGACTGADGDGDGFATCDCDDTDPAVWSSPGEVRVVRLAQQGATTQLEWEDPLETGASTWTFEVLRSATPENFFTATECVADLDETDRMAEDDIAPPAGTGLFYVVRARNGCPDGAGGVGRRSDGVPRPARSCP